MSLVIQTIGIQPIMFGWQDLSKMSIVLRYFSMLMKA